MANFQRNFILGRMNKGLDERLVPNGEYVDALNVRLGSTENTEIGSVENAKGNVRVTQLSVPATPSPINLSDDARCIGAYEDGANETLYWFVHDPNFPASPSGKCDLIVSYDVINFNLTYHVISTQTTSGVGTTLNFNPTYLITGVNLVDNLLFFTDDFNPPRFINVLRNYANPDAAFNDGITAEELLVIKKPPSNSPDVDAAIAATSANYMEDKFISFAYRWRYKDNEYSATSQFSEPNFLPDGFNYDFSTGLNSGMLNQSNLAIIEYNSGGPLVIGIDLLWKEMESNTIYVLEKLDKADLGLVDNVNYTFSFDSRKIFTLLPESEILRLFDNVPRLAKAQSLLGNRLIYGNYLEQYDLVDLNGFPLKLEYVVTLESEEIGLANLETETDTGAYSIDGGVSIPNSIIRILDLDSQNLVAGGLLEFQITVEHDSFSGPNPPPNATSQPTSLQFSYLLPQDFNSAFDLAISTDFVEKIGTSLPGGNIQTVALCQDGTTFTDIFNCFPTQTLDTLEKYESGISAPNQAISIIASQGSPDIAFQLLAMRYVDDPTGVAITEEAYEYYKITLTEATYTEVGIPKSLKSDRSYEIGIIYMDEFNRASTAQVSPNNAITIPCENSDLFNKAIVTIPTNQIAPEWATRYKFCIKADKDEYFNVFSQFYFRDPVGGADYFLLEGQNAAKVEVGDILKVKVDSNGPVLRCVTATVLDKSAEQRDFLGDENVPITDSGEELLIPQGVYAKIRANNFSTQVGDLPQVNYGTLKATDTGGNCSLIAYDITTEDTSNPGQRIPYTIPAGSRIRIRIKNIRRGKSCTFSGVERRVYELDQTFTSPEDYSSFITWFNGNNIANSFSSPPAIAQADCGATPPELTYNNTILLASTTGNTFPQQNDFPCTLDLSWQFFEDDTVAGGYQYACLVGLQGYNGKKKEAKLELEIEVLRGGQNLIVFETESQPALPDVWLESPVSYPIDTATGYHFGNRQNQSATLPAIIETAFFNCYSFGNGVESFQVRDAIEGKRLTLGNRAFITNNQEYKEIRRFADLTYSGVFNDESNVNKTNEFNLGLSNFKPLEEVYGPIYILDGRETDLLTLQEDKISYVLVGKNLLSDSTGGGAITSVPEVLGTQIARVEEFGISANPESYTKWGYNKFFTDAKRGAVLQLKGTSRQNESLTVISETGMRSWFRDLFINNFNTQKLGGYDPYMNEFVLSSNTIALPLKKVCIPCGITRTFTVKDGETYSFCVDVGQTVGDVNIPYKIVSATSDVTISATYNSVTVSDIAVSGATGTIVVNKQVVVETQVDIEVSAASGDADVEITVNCPDAQEISVFQICLTSSSISGQFTRNGYRWDDGQFSSPLHEEQVQFASGTTNPIVSQYFEITGPQGSTYIPTNGSTIRIQQRSLPPTDDFLLSGGGNAFKFLRSNTLYLNNLTDINTLLGLANPVTPVFFQNFVTFGETTMPNTSEQYVYLIYDYRESSEVELCYEPLSGDDTEDQFLACCGCNPSVSNLRVRRCQLDNTGATQEYVIAQPLPTVLNVNDFILLDNADGCIYRVVETTSDPVTGGIDYDIGVPINDCTDDACNTYSITNNGATTQSYNYLPCDATDESVIDTLDAGDTVTLCVLELSVPADFTVTFVQCECPDRWLVEKCQDPTVLTAADTEIVDAGAFTLSTNDRVILNGDPLCVYKCLYRVGSPTTDTINSTTTDTCNQVLNTYTITNNNLAGEDRVTYVDSSGATAQTGNIPATGSVQVCALSIDASTLPFGFTVTFNNCGCSV
jgi:hypothetical protein